MVAKKSAREKSAAAGSKGIAKKKKASPAKKKTSAGAKRKASKRSDTRLSAGARAGAARVRGGWGDKLPVVGVGASAGGLEAFTELLKHLPANTGMAFVFIQHLDPRHKSNLAEILARSTDMSIAEATGGVRLEADQIYVTPPNMEMAVLHGVLHLMPRPESPARHLPIDSFFRSLAEDQGNKAIGVILSGTGSDGALGLGAIKAESGITFVQDQESAKYGGMPSAAVAAGHVDFTFFATDVSDLAIDKAREGRYPENISADVSPERLRRFFLGSEDGYQISKPIRDMCVFAKHNVVKDPPFSKIDLLSCRNLLIYLGPELQKRVIPAFHYALKPAGCLMLGTSETIGGFSDLFSLFDKKYKLYSKKLTAARLPVDFGITDLAARPEPVAKQPPPVAWSRLDLQKEADRVGGASLSGSVRGGSRRPAGAKGAPGRQVQKEGNGCDAGK